MSTRDKPISNKSTTSVPSTVRNNSYTSSSNRDLADSEESENEKFASTVSKKSKTVESSSPTKPKSSVGSILEGLSKSSKPKPSTGLERIESPLEGLLTDVVSEKKSSITKPSASGRSIKIDVDDKVIRDRSTGTRTEDRVVDRLTKSPSGKTISKVEEEDIKIRDKSGRLIETEEIRRETRGTGSHKSVEVNKTVKTHPSPESDSSGEEVIETVKSSTKPKPSGGSVEIDVDDRKVRSSRTGSRTEDRVVDRVTRDKSGRVISSIEEEEITTKSKSGKVTEYDEIRRETRGTGSHKSIEVNEIKKTHPSIESDSSGEEVVETIRSSTKPKPTGGSVEIDVDDKVVRNSRTGSSKEDRVVDRITRDKSGRVTSKIEDEEIISKDRSGRVTESREIRRDTKGSGSHRSIEVDEVIKKHSSRTSREPDSSPILDAQRTHTSTPSRSSSHRSRGSLITSSKVSLDKDAISHVKNYLKFFSKNGFLIHNVVRVIGDLHCHGTRKDGTPCTALCRKGKAYCDLHTNKKDTDQCEYYIELETLSGTRFFTAIAVIGDGCTNTSVDEYVIDEKLDVETGNSIMKTINELNELNIVDHVACVDSKGRLFTILNIDNERIGSVHEHRGRQIKKLFHTGLMSLIIPGDDFKHEGKFISGDELSKTIDRINTQDAVLFSLYVSSETDKINREVDIVETLNAAIQKHIREKEELIESLKDAVVENITERLDIANTLFKNFQESVDVGSSSVTVEDFKASAVSTKALRHILEKFFKEEDHKETRMNIIEEFTKGLEHKTAGMIAMEEFIKHEMKDSKHLEKFKEENGLKLVNDTIRDHPRESELSFDLGTFGEEGSVVSDVLDMAGDATSLDGDVNEAFEEFNPEEILESGDEFNPLESDILGDSEEEN